MSGRAWKRERERGDVSCRVHNLVQDIARECNPLTLRRPSSYRCLPYMLDGTTVRDSYICFRFESPAENHVRQVKRSRQWKRGGVRLVPSFRVKHRIRSHRDARRVTERPWLPASPLAAPAAGPRKQLATGSDATAVVVVNIGRTPVLVRASEGSNYLRSGSSLLRYLGSCR
ncbi:hypothetical protein ALC56_03878 [Trachymyrmex septentrionalis]|uniref:Uncharacterized protein n=1 Tax=Trachymyrmex septentrionalis TaxID=34720 RepID=A0A195FM11_9HYME|nr:hypothetical protein ALC56_03878 [Trachymyrmex septentrionalis]